MSELPLASAFCVVCVTLRLGMSAPGIFCKSFVQHMCTVGCSSAMNGSCHAFAALLFYAYLPHLSLLTMTSQLAYTLLSMVLVL